MSNGGYQVVGTYEEGEEEQQEEEQQEQGINIHDPHLIYSTRKQPFLRVFLNLCSLAGWNMMEGELIGLEKMLDDNFRGDGDEEEVVEREIVPFIPGDQIWGKTEYRRLVHCSVGMFNHVKDLWCFLLLLYLISGIFVETDSFPQLLNALFLIMFLMTFFFVRLHMGACLQMAGKHLRMEKPFETEAMWCSIAAVGTYIGMTIWATQDLVSGGYFHAADVRMWLAILLNALVMILQTMQYFINIFMWSVLIKVASRDRKRLGRLVLGMGDDAEELEVFESTLNNNFWALHRIVDFFSARLTWVAIPQVVMMLVSLIGIASRNLRSAALQTDIGVSILTLFWFIILVSMPAVVSHQTLLIEKMASDVVARTKNMELGHLVAFLKGAKARAKMGGFRVTPQFAMRMIYFFIFTISLYVNKDAFFLA